MSKRVFRMGVGMALVAFAFVVTDEQVRAPGVMEQTARRIKVGMTKAEVDAILGIRLSWGGCINANGHSISDTHTWTGAEGNLSVTFGRQFTPEEMQDLLNALAGAGPPVPLRNRSLLDGAVVASVSFQRRPATSLLDHLRAWLGG